MLNSTILLPELLPLQARWSQTAAQLNGSAISVLLPDGRALIAHDVNAEIYERLNGTFTLTGAYTDPNPVSVDTATLLPDGMVLVTGCAAQCSAGATELYDPQADKFSPTGPRKAWDTYKHGNFAYGR